MRTDLHRPGVLEPADYQPVAAFYQGDRDLMSYSGRNREDYEAAISTGPVFKGNFAAKKTCDSCGAKFDYGALFRHGPTSELIHVGHICAEKLGMEMGHIQRVRDAAEREIREARRRKIEETGRVQMFARYSSVCADCGGRIRRGQQIEWDIKNRVARHSEGCKAPRPAKSPPTAGAVAQAFARAGLVTS